MAQSLWVFTEEYWAELCGMLVTGVKYLAQAVQAQVDN